MKSQTKVISVTLATSLAASLASILSIGAYAAESAPFTLAPNIFSNPSVAFNAAQQAFSALQAQGALPTSAADLQANTFTLKQMSKAHGVRSARFQHFFKGLEVVGSQALHHEGAAGQQVTDQIAHFDINVQPGLSMNDVANVATGATGASVDAAPQLKILPGRDRGEGRLVYYVSLAGTDHRDPAELIIDAQSGQLIAEQSKHTDIAPIDIYSAANQGLQVDQAQNGACDVTDLSTGTQKHVSAAQCKKLNLNSVCQAIDNSGEPITVNPTACQADVSQNTVEAAAASDVTVQYAQRNTQIVLNYYQTAHNRDSYDGKGATVVSVIHIGKGYANAFWVQDQNFMSYGDGDGQVLGNMASAIDVAGHELTHGVTANTAQLTRIDESGALNEAYSDFFGLAIKGGGGWVVGQGLFIGNPDRGIRDLANPASIIGQVLDQNGQPMQRAYPATVADKAPIYGACNASNDYCYVHYDSTIPSHASYLIAMAIGQQQTEQLYYLTLTQYLTPQSTFLTAATSTMQACAQIFDGPTCDKVHAAFVQVGMAQ